MTCIRVRSNAWPFWRDPSDKSDSRKIFEGEISITTQPTLFLQILCSCIYIHLQVISKTGEASRWQLQGELSSTRMGKLPYYRKHCYSSSVFNPYAAGGQFSQHDMITKSWEMIETLANGYSSDSAQRELFNKYQHDRVKMIFITFCFLVHKTKVTSASEGLR